MVFEGGFQGRTNKLVDGCYSFWVGALIPLIQAVEKSKLIRDGDQGSLKQSKESRSFRHFRCYYPTFRSII